MCKPKEVSAHEFVAHSVYGAEVYRTGGVAFQFLAQLQDVIIDGAGRRIILISPNLIQQLVTADDAVGILHQELQGLEFLGGQDHDLAVALHLHFLEVDRDAVEADAIHIGGSGGMPQGGAHAGQQLARAERLGHVIVGPEFEQENLVGNIAGGAEHEDGQAWRLRLDLFAKVTSRKLRQTQVEDDDGGLRNQKAFQRRLSIPLNFDCVTFRLKQALERFLDGG